jgi:hypothetical protein
LYPTRETHWLPEQYLKVCLQHVEIYIYICKLSLQMMKQFLHTYCISVHSRFCPGLRQNLYIQILSLLKFLFLLSNEMANIILLRTWDNLTPLLWAMFHNMWLFKTEHGFRKVLAALDKLFRTLFQFILTIVMPSIPHVGPTIFMM